MKHEPQLLRTLSTLRDVARRRFRADDFDEAWIASAVTVISERWPVASLQEAEILIDIIASVPHAQWVDDYLLPARHDRVPHAKLLTRRYEDVAAAAAEGIARDDGLTRRA